MFEGLSAFPTTPTNADGEVDAVALARVLDRLAEAKVGSIGLLGSTVPMPTFHAKKDAVRLRLQRKALASAFRCLWA